MAEDRVLRKDLSTFSLTALIMGAMIGSGIFFLPGVMLAQTGSAWPVMAAWILGAAVALTGGLVFAELGAAFPKAGGQYAFLRDSLGQRWGFLFSWSGFSVVQTGTIAAVAVAMANALDGLIALPGSTPCLGAYDGDFCDGLVLPKWGVGFFAIAIITLLTLINYLGVRRGALVNNAATIAKVGALVLIAILAFGRGTGAGNFSAGGWGAVTMGGFGLALAGSLFAYDGFAQATFVAAEVRDARRALPRAIVFATVLVAIIYLVATFAFFHIVPIGEVSQAALEGSAPIADQAMRIAVGGIAAALVLVAIMISTFGTVNTYVLTSPRIYHPIAREGEFPKAFGKLSKHGTPTYGLIYGAIWAGILTMTGSFAALANLVVFVLYVFYLATMVGYFILRKREPQAFLDGGFKVPLRPLPAVFFGIASIAVLITYLYGDIQLIFDGHFGAFAASTTGLGILLIAIGIGLFSLQNRRAQRST